MGISAEASQGGSGLQGTSGNFWSYGHGTGSQWVEARAAAGIPTMHRTASTTKNYPAPTVHGLRRRSQKLDRRGSPWPRSACRRCVGGRAELRLVLHCGRKWWWSDEVRGHEGREEQNAG